MIKIRLDGKKLGEKTVMTKEIADARYERCNDGYMMTSWYLDPEKKEAGVMLSYVLYEDGTVEWSYSPSLYKRSTESIEFEYVEELDWIISPDCVLESM